MDGSMIDNQKVTEELLLEMGYRKYHGKDIDIYWSEEICAHVGNCVRGNHAVFEVGRRPWVIPDNSTVADDIAVINTCPSGALKYIEK
ncbi:MAG: (4Fe-4S)-binding protein [Streptococcaceae bacterium]|jgi:uncharacterized Fe-S cluster protein YjdI|nr:(4Fe-4S)-binding protein [Streptococcaceae bacterium]